MQVEKVESTPAKVSGTKKEASQWYDVGIIKGTSCVVSHYHLPSEASQGNGDVSASLKRFLSLLFRYLNSQL